MLNNTVKKILFLTILIVINSNIYANNEEIKLETQKITDFCNDINSKLDKLKINPYLSKELKSFNNSFCSSLAKDSEVLSQKKILIKEDYISQITKYLLGNITNLESDSKKIQDISCLYMPLLDINHQNITKAYIEYYINNNEDLAISLLEKNEVSRLPFLYYEVLAKIYKIEKKFKKIDKLMINLESNYPNHYYTYYLKGISYAEYKPQKAYNFFKKAFKLSHDLSVFDLAYIPLEEMKDYKELVSLYENYLSEDYSIFANDTDYIRAIINAYVKLNKYKEAEEFLQIAYNFKKKYAMIEGDEEIFIKLRNQIKTQF